MMALTQNREPASLISEASFPENPKPQRKACASFGEPKMKKAPFILTLTIILLMLFGPNLSRSTSAAPAQKTIDPVCVEFCREELYLCILNSQTNGEEKSCISVYRSCIARCK